MVFELLLLCLLSVVCLPFSPTAADTEACTKVDACSCKFQDGSLLSLRSLAGSNGTAGLHALNAHGGMFSFYYNPCIAFTQGGCGGGDVAVCQHDNSAQSGFNHYICGVQPSAQFVYRDGDNSNLYLKFTGGDNDRTSYIKLICSNGTESSLSYVSEDPALVYNLELTSPCACPGVKACDTLPKVRCDQEDSCSCRMSDGSGTIHLGALSSPKSPLEYKSSDQEQFYYNPCMGFTLSSKNATVNQCDDVSVCERKDAGLPGEEYLNLGKADNPTFEMDDDRGVSIVYTGEGGRRSTVWLICDRAVREKPVFKLEQASGNKFTFSLRSICACPGGCVAPQRQCSQVDSCTCRYEDGSGTVSLHSLDNPFAPLITKTFQTTVMIFTYFYNPCSGVKLGGACSNVSACQQVNDSIPQTSQTFRLGAVQPVVFDGGNDNGLAIHYGGGDGNRAFQVQLVCDKEAAIPVFGNATENPLNHYTFTLRSKCACVNGCPGK